MKKLITTATALIAFAGFTGLAQAHVLDPVDAEEIIEEMADEEVEAEELQDYEITGSEEVSDHKVYVYVDTLENDDSECEVEMLVKLRSNSNRVTVRQTDVECTE